MGFLIDSSVLIALEREKLTLEALRMDLMIGSHDLLIAATARSRSFGVMTLNEREFQRISELTVYNPLD